MSQVIVLQLRPEGLAAICSAVMVLAQTGVWPKSATLAKIETKASAADQEIRRRHRARWNSRDFMWPSILKGLGDDSRVARLGPPRELIAPVWKLKVNAG
jgi:hypothetical protein